MNLKELREKPREWKVIDSTRKEMIGNIFEEYLYHTHHKTVALSNKDKSDYYVFKLSDLQEMTPLEYNGVRIGIGDEVELNGFGWEVYGYTWYDGKWQIVCAREKYYGYTVIFSQDNISGHKLLHSKKEPLELTLDQIAEKFGVEEVKIKK